MKEKRSDDYYVDVPKGIATQQMMAIVARAADSAGLYIFHIGGYSRTKYPNSVHWHFKRQGNEPGLLDATFWDVQSLFCLMIRHREPQWVKDMVPILLRALRREVAALENNGEITG
jgi:hypothetical protein